MAHHFMYPTVSEIRDGDLWDGRSAAEGSGRWRSQRDLVVASLLRCPDRSAANGGPYDVRRVR